MSAQPNQRDNGREVRGVVSGSRQHFSRAVRAGDLLFLSGNAYDGDGNPLPDAVPVPPYHMSPAAHCVAQVRALYDQYRPFLDEYGATFEDMVQIEQYIPHKIYGDPYVNTSRGPGYLERNRPTSALLVTGDLGPSRETVITHTGIIALRAQGAEKQIVHAENEFTADTVNSDYGDSWAEEPPFHEVETAGAHLYTVGDMAFDWEKGAIPDGVKVQPFTYWGSEIRNETEFLLHRLQKFAASVGATLADITHVSVYLTEISDIFELDRVWHKYFGDHPPARTIVPVRAHGSPRFEAPHLTHADNAVRLEHITQGIVPGRGVTREDIVTPYAPLGHETVAVRADNLIWISQQYGRPRDEAQVTGDTAAQIDIIFTRLRIIATAAGADLSGAVRIRAFFTDITEQDLLTEALRKAFPTDPPTLITTGTGGDLLIPGATVTIDAILHAPR